MSFSLRKFSFHKLFQLKQKETSNFCLAIIVKTKKINPQGLSTQCKETGLYSYFLVCKII